jgi:predicted Zn-dependent peptidase
VKHPLRVDIAGTEAMVRQIGPDELHTCHAAWYHPSNLTLIVCGDMKPADVLRRAEAASSRFAPAAPAQRIESVLPAEPAKVAQARAERRMFIARPRLLVGFKDAVAPQGEELAKLDLVSGIALDALLSKESETHEKLYARGLIGSDFGAGFQAEKGFGYTVIGGETSDPDTLYRELLLVLDDARAHGVKPEVIERKRRKFVGAYVRYFNDPESTAFAYLGALSQGSELFDIPAIAESITTEQVNERIREMFDPSHRPISVLLPLGE